jgi:hypothetical protein
LEANIAGEELILMTKSTLSSRLLLRAIFQFPCKTVGGLHVRVFERTKVAGVALLVITVELLLYTH